MKQVLKTMARDFGIANLKWYHYIILLWWVLSLFLMTGECDNMWYYAITLPNFSLASLALRFVPVEETDE